MKSAKASLGRESIKNNFPCTVIIDSPNIFTFCEVICKDAFGAFSAFLLAVVQFNLLTCEK